MLAQANKKKKKVLIASTSEVYGLSDQVPFREDGNLVLGRTTKGRWSYACSKAIDEFLALAYWREKKLPTIVVRLFNTVGPRQTGQYGMVVPTFVKQALAGRADHRLRRRHAVALLHPRRRRRRRPDRADRPPGRGGQVFNIGSNEEVTIRELAERVKALTGSRSEIVLVPYERGLRGRFEDMPRRVPDIARSAR